MKSPDPRRPTPDQVRALIAERLVDREIGELFGVTGMVIASIRYKHGIKAADRWTAERSAAHAASISQAHAEKQARAAFWARDILPRPIDERKWVGALAGARFADAATPATIAQRHDRPATYVGGEASS